jgi:DNA-binding NtrC family response regulator
MKVLFIDDNPAEINCYKGITEDIRLYHPDMEFIFCKTAEEANKEIKTNNIALLNVDMNLHDKHGLMGGLVWYEGLIRAGKSYPIIAMSGHPDIMQAVRAVTKSPYIDTWDKETGCEILKEKIMSMLHRSKAESRFKNMEQMTLENTGEIQGLRKDVQAILQGQNEMREMMFKFAGSDDRAIALFVCRIIPKKARGWIKNLVGLQPGPSSPGIQNLPQ